MPASLTSSVLQLRVAVLLDHEHLAVRGDEVEDLVLERERADAQRIDVDVLLGELLERLVHRRRWWSRSR